MNPEFQRNLWLELSLVRVVWMVAVLAVIFWLTAMIADQDSDDAVRSVATVGEGLFLAIVGVWGSFKAGRSVADEIRERTWDFQRLSALPPRAMTIGKLFGATAYVWTGGLVCLAMMLLADSATDRVPDPLLHALRLMFIGVFAHAAALAASLAFVRRGRGARRVDAFGFMVAGLGALGAAGVLGEMAGGGGLGRSYEPMEAGLSWWGVLPAGPQAATLLTLALAVWAAFSAWRLMRIELAARPNPIWYLGFLAVPVLVLVGFAPQGQFGRWALEDLARPASFGLQLFIAYLITHALVWITMLIEPKDLIAWRKVLEGGGQRAAAWPATLTGLLAAGVLAAAGAAALAGQEGPNGEAPGLGLIAAFAFLLRDAAIVLFFNLSERPARADFTAVLTILLLAALGTGVVSALTLGAGQGVLAGVFWSNPTASAAAQLVSIVSAAAQALGFGLAAHARWRARTGHLARV